MLRMRTPLGSYSCSCRANDKPVDALAAEVAPLLPTNNSTFNGLNRANAVVDHRVCVADWVRVGDARVGVTAGVPPGVGVTADDTLGVAHPDG